MAADVDITAEDDASPYVRMIAALLRRAAHERGLSKTISGLEGVYSYRSPRNNQTATIRFTKGQVRVEGGIARDTETVVINDLSRLLDPGAKKPEVKGSRRLSISAGRILESTASTWQEEAASFWPAVFADVDVPRPVLVTATDTNDSQTFGPDGVDGVDGSVVYELAGPSYRLIALFAGFTSLGAELRARDISVVGSANHTAALARQSLAWTLGDQ